MSLDYFYSGLHRGRGHNNLPGKLRENLQQRPGGIVTGEWRGDERANWSIIHWLSPPGDLDGIM